MNKLYISSLLIVIFLSGCVNNFNTKCDPKSVQKLTKEEKKKLYAHILNDIDALLDDAITYHEKSYYLKALQSYELINFYKKNTIPPHTIEKLKHRIEANQKHYYDKAVSGKYANDTMKQLFYLNELMRNNPEYQDGKILYNKLRQYAQVIKTLQPNKAILQELLEKDSNEQKYISSLNNIINKIAYYDDWDPLVIQGKKVLRAKRYILRDEAIKLYNQNKFAQSKDMFNLIKTIYEKDRTSDRYLKIITNDTTLVTMETKAATALKNSNYKEAIEIANNILSFNSHNSKALDIFQKANKELKKQIPKMIKQATKYYSKQEYDKALKVFQDILKLDSRNNTALTYTKKIKAQLRTIRNLKGK